MKQVLNQPFMFIFENIILFYFIIFLVKYLSLEQKHHPATMSFHLKILCFPIIFFTIKLVQNVKYFFLDNCNISANPKQKSNTSKWFKSINAQYAHLNSILFTKTAFHICQNDCGKAIFHMYFGLEMGFYSKQEEY